MLIRCIKLSIYACLLLFAAKSIGLSDTYRINPTISEQDFSSSQINRWQSQAKDIVSITQGQWYWKLFGANTRIVFKNFQGLEQTLLIEDLRSNWDNCSGTFHFEPPTATLKSDIEAACIDKRSFQRNVSSLVKTAVEKVSLHQAKALQEHSSKERNLRSWL